ncbi:hypothetical protein QP731_17500, partial [Sphingomonas sp. UMB7805-LC452B]
MSDARGVLRICRNGYVEPAPPPAPSFIPSDAIGVGNLCKVAPDEPAAGSLVIGSDVASTNHDRPAGVADCLQCSDDGVSAPSSEIRAVLKSEPTRTDLSDDADGFEVEARALPFDAAAFGVGAADVLAGRGADDDGRKPSKISEKSVCRKGADIVVNLHAWIVFGIERAPPRFDLAGSGRCETGAVHTKGPAPGGRAEQVEHLPHFRPSPCERAERAESVNSIRLISSR